MSTPLILVSDKSEERKEYTTLPEGHIERMFPREPGQHCFCGVPIELLSREELEGALVYALKELKKANGRSFRS